MNPKYACALLLVFLASPVWAQTAAPPEANAPRLSESLHGPAKDTYESGKLLAANRDFAGALSKFRQAYEISNDPRLLYDMAVCEKDLQHYARMQVLLRRYQREAGTRLSPEERAMVDDALAASSHLVATVTLTATQDGATVRVDGEPAGTTPLARPLALDLGNHTLVVEKSGFETSERTIDALGGAESAIAVTLRPQTLVARLLLTTEDEATVTIDGTVVGKGRFEGPLASGGHEVRVTESGKTAYQTHVELRVGEMRTMEVTLQGERSAAIWPWVVGGVAVAAGAAVGGYFLFRPQEQTTAVPPGALGLVQFQSWRP
ncbi:MAG: PEGA domain-containing protein [Myxococcota bacterium]|nr:PEGA domain-containing protein [Myxococcota bacterium]